MFRATKLALALAAAAALVPVGAQGQTATANLTVSATVAKRCTVSGTSVAFAGYDPVIANASTSAPLDAEGTFNVQCTKGVTYSVTLGNGANYDGASGKRAMKSGTALLSYDLYTDTGRSNAWIGATDVSRQAPSKDAVAITVYGRIPGGQDVPSASDYSDTVVITVAF